ncbi:MAG: glycine/sarcosine/betaine reductase complex component C subunit alpha, partial [Candidatus Adiutrix sp.]
MSENKKIIGKALANIVQKAKSGFTPITVGLMAGGSELGTDELLRGAKLAQGENPRLKVVAIGPKVKGYDFQWLECAENDMAKTTEDALASGYIQGAVALHYPFPVGVTTIGRVVTPTRGRPLLIASSTGASSAHLPSSLVLNAVYGVAVAKSLGLENPSLGILNISGANQTLRALNTLKDSGYQLNFGASRRADGGAILRGNDLLSPQIDICLCDSLTGNILVKMFSGWQSGGNFEAVGWGYGPSVGLGWSSIISIISRVSGAPVVAGALNFTALSILADLPQLVHKEM